MAIVSYIKEKTQSKTAMRRVVNYVKQDKKTMFEDENAFKYNLISGKDCCPETAFEEFMATKKQYKKDHGTFFYQYLQSFSPDENVTAETVHKIGLELAEYFKDYEVLVATHIDANHLHNHLIINSVSHTTGLKLQVGPDSVFKLRNLSDEICLGHGLSVLKTYLQEKNNLKSMGAREYRAAVDGNSWKFKLINAIDEAIKNSSNKNEFISKMKSLGYNVNWKNNHKYITYTTPDGKKCRDNKLHEERYLKSQMEGYFNEHARIEEQKQTTGSGTSRRNDTQAIHSNDLRNTTGTLGSDNNAFGRTRQSQFSHTGELVETTTMAEYKERTSPNDNVDKWGTSQNSGGERQKYKAPNVASGNESGQATGRDEVENRQSVKFIKRNTDGGNESKGLVPNENKTEMVGDRSPNFANILDSANHLAQLIPTKKYDNSKENNKNEYRDIEKASEKIKKEYSESYEDEDEWEL